VTSTVDWVHLKLNDQAQRTVLLKDPFRARDERVEKLIDGPVTTGGGGARRLAMARARAARFVD